VQKVQRAPMGCTNHRLVRTQGQNAGRERVRQRILGGSGLDWRNLHWAGGCGRGMTVGGGHWMCGDVWFWGVVLGPRVARRASRLPIDPAFIFAIFAFSRFLSTFRRSESNPRFRFHHGVPSRHYPHRIHGSAPAVREVTSHPGLPTLGKGRNGQEESTRDEYSRIHVQYPDRSPTAHRRFRGRGKPVAERRWFVDDGYRGDG
jgi:hypothetical protein